MTLYISPCSLFNATIKPLFMDDRKKERHTRGQRYFYERQVWNAASTNNRNKKRDDEYGEILLIFVFLFPWVESTQHVVAPSGGRRVRPSRPAPPLIHPKDSATQSKDLDTSVARASNLDFTFFRNCGKHLSQIRW